GQVALARIGGQLVDAPDETGAVVAHGALARPAPDVRVADVREGGRDDAALPGRQLRKREVQGRLLRLFDRPARGVARRRGARARVAVLPPVVRAGVEAEDLRERVGGLRPGRRLLRLELELVLAGRVVEPQAEQPGDDLGAEAARRC